MKPAHLREKDRPAIEHAIINKAKGKVETSVLNRVIGIFEYRTFWIQQRLHFRALLNWLDFFPSLNLVLQIEPLHYYLAESHPICACWFVNWPHMRGRLRSEISTVLRKCQKSEWPFDECICLVQLYEWAHDFLSVVSLSVGDRVDARF